MRTKLVTPPKTAKNGPRKRLGRQAGSEANERIEKALEALFFTSKRCKNG